MKQFLWQSGVHTDERAAMKTTENPEKTRNRAVRLSATSSSNSSSSTTLAPLVLKTSQRKSGATKERLQGCLAPGDCSAVFIPSLLSPIVDSSLRGPSAVFEEGAGEGAAAAAATWLQSSSSLLRSLSPRLGLLSISIVGRGLRRMHWHPEIAVSPQTRMMGRRRSATRQREMTTR